jgi:hypothetical protein
MHFLEKILQDAADRGEFDTGTSAGKSLRIDDTGPGWWARREAARVAAKDRADDVAAAVERSLGQVWRIRSEAEVRARVDELNALLRVHGVADADLDHDEVVATWKRMARLRSNTTTR